ncbi:MAG: hypothetical protein WCH85_08885 [Methanomicrobiales archaeon]
MMVIPGFRSIPSIIPVPETLSHFRYRSPSYTLRFLPGPGPFLFRAIVKWPAMTGSRPDRYAESRSDTGFQQEMR